MEGNRSAAGRSHRALDAAITVELAANHRGARGVARRGREACSGNVAELGLPPSDGGNWRVLAMLRYSEA
jgi:hypothetical protein